MKKCTLLFTIFIFTLVSAMSCREDKSAAEKVEDGIEEVGEGLEEGAEEIEDEAEELADDN